MKSPPKPKRVEERTVLLIEKDGRILIDRRPPKGLLASLYELPSVPGHMTPEEAVAYLGLSPAQVSRAEALPLRPACIFPCGMAYDGLPAGALTGGAGGQPPGCFDFPRCVFCGEGGACAHICPSQRFCRL